MKIYILVTKDKNGKQTIHMPINFGRNVRAYTSKPMAQRYAKKFNAIAYEFDTEDGVIV